MIRCMMISVALAVAGCSEMRDRMTAQGYPAAYSIGYQDGRAGFSTVLTDVKRTDLYRQGYADGRRDKAAGMTGDPPAPRFEAPGR